MKSYWGAARAVAFVAMRSWLIGTALVVLVAVPLWAADEHVTLQVATYNIRFANPSDGPNAWPHRKTAVAQLLLEYRVDLAGMQEVLASQLGDLKELMPAYDFFGVGRDDGKERGEFSPIAYHRGRLRLVEGSTRWLSEQPNVPGSKSWDAAITRIATRCVFEIRATGQWIVVYNTHFDHLGKEARRHSARLLREWSQQEVWPTLVMGDFNCVDTEPPYAELTGPRAGGALRDARILAQETKGPNSTWNGFEKIEPDQRIDFVFTSPAWKVQRHVVDDRRIAAQRFPSDHLPVVVQLSAPRAPEGATAVPGVRAINVQRTHPVLIRNDACPLVQVAIDVEGDTTQRIEALAFELRGEDLAADVESVSVLDTAEQPTFSAARQFGATVPAAAKVTIRGERLLSAGRNNLWLACRLKAGANLTHGIEARCVAIETVAGRVAVYDQEPPRRHRVGVALRRSQEDGVHTYRIPALTTTRDGTLLCVYDMRRKAGRDLQGDIDIGLSRSMDGGRTWESPRTIMDMGETMGLPQDQNGCSDPGIIVDHQTGEIFCFAVWMWGKPGKHQWTGDGSEAGYEIGKSAQLLMVRSTDDGRTWSTPTNLTRTLKREAWWLLAPSPQSGIQLPDGTLVMPCQGRDEHGVPFAALLVSRDHGQNWQVSQSAYREGNECQVAPLSDGSLMLNMRNDRERYRAVYVTKDLGSTWSEHSTNRKTLIEPNCNGSLIAVPHGTGAERRHYLLFANPHTQQGRTHHTIQVSDDDGCTWPLRRHTLLDEGRGAGYPSMTRIGDHEIGIVYEGSQSHLVFEKFTLAELFDR